MAPSTRRAADILRQPAWALLAKVAEGNHGEAVHTSAWQQDGCCRPRFYMLAVVLGDHLDGMGVLDPDARRLLAWDFGNVERTEQVEEKEEEGLEEEVDEPKEADETDEAEEVESNTSSPH